MPPDEIPDTETDPTAPKTVPMHVFIKARKDLQKRAETAEASAKAANARYEAAAQANADQQTAHAEALANQQHEFAASRVFDSIGAAGDEHSDTRSWLNSKYASVEASVPEGAPEGTEPVKPTFAEWVPTFVAKSPTMVAYRKAPEAVAPATALDAKRAAAGAVKRNTATDPAARTAQDAGGGAEAPASQAAYLRLDPAQKRAELERQGLIAPLQPAAE